MAERLRITAGDARRLGISDSIIPEPEGTAKHDPVGAAGAVRKAILHHIGELNRMSPDRRRKARTERYRTLGSEYITRENA